MKEAGRERRGGTSGGTLLWVVLLGLLASCGPGGLPSAAGGAGAEGGAAASGPGSAAAPAPAAPAPRPVLLDPIVETRSQSSDRSLAKEDLQDLGELGILPHVVQSLSSGAPCDFKDALRPCH